MLFPTNIFTFNTLLLTFSLMAKYPPEVMARFLGPKFAGRADNQNALGTSASFECGCFVRISLSIGLADKKIAAAGLQSNGCGFMIAAADVLAEHLIGRELTELHSVDANKLIEVVRERLVDVPVERVQCVHVVLEAIRAALSDYRSYLIEEFRGEKPLICTCFGVSEEAVENFITENAPGSVEEVTAACRAGGGCGSCRMLIQEMLDARM